MAQIFATVADGGQNGKKLEKAADVIYKISLNVDGFNPQLRVKELTAQLHGHGVPIVLANRIVLSAVGGTGAGMPVYPSPNVLQQANVFDLFRALTIHGRLLYASAREVVEQLAYSILIGKTKLR